MRGAIEEIVVVVPARDEERLLPACLDALEVAAAAVVVPARVVVVLDACVDDTASTLLGRDDVEAVVSAEARVGAARRLGVAHGIRTSSLTDPGRLWIACSDADSQVPADWLRHQIELADFGADLVLGTVDLSPSALLAAHAQPWRRRYRRWITPSGTHRHVHGANLGVRASSYLAAGGFEPVTAHEDVRLVRAVRATADSVVVSTSAVPVLTSDRLIARAPIGLAADLRRLAARTSRLRSTACARPRLPSGSRGPTAI